MDIEYIYCPFLSEKLRRWLKRQMELGLLNYRALLDYKAYIHTDRRVNGVSEVVMFPKKPVKPETDSRKRVSLEKKAVSKGGKS